MTSATVCKNCDISNSCKNVNAWSLFDNLIVTCDKSENTLENAGTIPSNGINY